ncbi:hypothetical protein [Ruminococcus sp. 210702-SL.1.03]|jgi:hypothetical protein|uniref:hypothetical protein n=1 Tax=Ruminococcus sp. 210702-SL.1.03 TaxID=2883233 RepID=UPI001D063F0F|nr:hypothetical protein [Ruminococcus sp. 210702-SL.1.03]MCB6617289.1 hypothetical protein [Ruminococcus sp. 210702-SL.1.03]
MIDLQKYLFNKVLLIDIDGKQWNGYVFSFHDKDDNEDEEDSITLKVTDSEKLIEFTESEIKSIKIA